MTGPLSRIGPILVLLVVLVISAALGYLMAITSVQIMDTGIWQLRPEYQGVYIQAVADAYAGDNDRAAAIQRLSYLCQENGGIEAALAQAETVYNDPQRAANRDALRSVLGEVQESTEAGVCSASAADFGVPSILPLALLIVMALIIVGAGVMRIISASEEEAVGTGAAPAVGERVRPTLPGLGRKKPEQAGETLRSAAARGAALSAQAEKTDFTSQGNEPPVVQFMTTYLHGDDLYDDSFSIETPGGEFLGECGVGISETLSSTDAKNVTAFEVWLFDKNDIRTVTKVLMSDHAYNDDAIRAKLAPKGEAVKVEPGMRMNLETASLRIQARIVDLSYASGQFPPNSVFERITIELAAWKRDGSGAGSPIPAGRVNLPGSTS